MADKIIGKERAILIAKLAILSTPALNRTSEDSVIYAEELLTAAENLVIEKYGEYR